MEKKILIIATRQFWPVSSGKEITLYYNCKGLHEKYGYDIYLICFSNKQTDELREKPSFIREVKYVKVHSLKDMPGSLIVNGVFKGWPIQNAMFYSKRIGRFLYNYYQEIQPCAVFFDMIRLAPYVHWFKNISAKKILIEDDLLAKRYRRQIISGRGGNVAGYLSNSVPGFLNRLTNASIIRNLILKEEARRLDRYEKDCPKHFDYVTFISPIEMREYNQLHNTQKGITLTVGTDVEYFSQPVSVELKKNHLVLVGNFEYAPNAASIKWIDEDIMPRLPSDIVLDVIGKFPDSLKDEIKSSNIHPLGYVDDLRYAVKSCAVYLSPIAFGTGIKNKVVEAMAMGMPVITNSIGAEGLDVQNGKQLFIAETAEEITDIIKELLVNEELRLSVGKAGQQFVRDHHDWNIVYSAFEKMGL